MEFLRILEELGWPQIYLVTPKQFEHIDGDKLESEFGNSNALHGIITIRQGLRGKVKRNTIWHEIGHIIHPNKPEWWIILFGEKMARGGGIGSSQYLNGHTSDELPARSVLLKLAQRASLRYNQK